MDDFRKHFYERWQKLCDAHTSVQDLALERNRVVDQHPVPLHQEIDALQAAYSRMKDIEREMDEAIQLWLEYLRNVG